MAIKQTVTESDFRDAFQAIRPDNFSYERLGALYDYLENLSDDIGEDIELDVISLCGEFTEYDEEQARREFDIDPDVEDWQSEVPNAIASGGDFVIVQNRGG